MILCVIFASFLFWKETVGCEASLPVLPPKRKKVKLDHLEISIGNQDKSNIFDHLRS